MNRRHIFTAALIVTAAIAGPASMASVESPRAAHSSSLPAVAYKYAAVGGYKIFYREAGDPAAPTVVLLHGFPSSSHMYRNLIPLLADRYHVIAPDMPGFGLSDAPDRARFKYTFDNLANTMESFLQTIGVETYAIQIFDYGAPIGLRLALAHPERITAIISQNGNAYEEGLGGDWQPIRKYWKEPSRENREPLRSFLKPDTIKSYQYLNGASDVTQVSPDGYIVDSAFLARPGNDEIQLDLFLDYASNVALYPRFQAYFRKYHPPLLAVWGRRDPLFIPPGAEAFKRDDPNAEVHLYDAGHFALETKLDEIAPEIHGFLDRTIGRK
jgi:pimeloyl-ACP methyl ester carboxylesterase